MAGTSGEKEDGLPEEELDEGREDGMFPDDKADAEDGIEESLHSALNDLERMLNHHEGADAPGESTPQPGRPGLDEDGEQYTIPLLDEVVIPGQPVAATAGAIDQADEGQAIHDESEPALRARIATRLASEMDVIMQDRIEDALERAREEIRKRIRDHLDIILPEIVDELMQARRQQGDG